MHFLTAPGLIRRCCSCCCCRCCLALQGLLLQISSNWRALHPVVRPRAVWICCYHLVLQSVLDVAWNSLVDASECPARRAVAEWPAEQAATE